ncbi:hypothetical protein [Adhaeribacter rhizoryzae]|uniref:Lipoprotein n=1 Tax=Adhaeribacter rhizoryzae TaxID=2607907 RepID=A0A5M6CXH9_9BACT|nr:hypothetical protein [Adhaeribacter rhizoryzae]KAA5539110.1 hypothetical protein F0145_24895 [Adhaeribacter rhizoryzae]
MVGKKYVIELIPFQRCCKILWLLVLPLLVVACHNTKSLVLLDAQEGDVKLEVDSILSWPEMAHFPIRVRLINYTDKKVALVFDSISNKYENQVKNLFITSGKDTFTLGVRISGMPLVLNERTVTSFNCEGYFIYGKGHFDSFDEIESVFKNGKLVYKFDDKILQQDHIRGMLIQADTILIPTILEASTNKASLVESFLPRSFWTREEKLKKEEIRHTITDTKH